VTLDRGLKGPDHPFALDPDAMRDLVKSVRDTEKALGTSKRVLSQSELAARTVTRRSFVARIDIKKGEALTDENVKVTRPGTGIHPKFKDRLLGRKAAKDIAKEDVISWEMVE
jgi:sialic acid synthase SpsE